MTQITVGPYCTAGHETGEGVKTGNLPGARERTLSMTPLHLAVLALVLLVALIAYGIRRSPSRDVPQLVQVGGRAVVLLGLGSLGVIMVDPADVPSVIQALLARF
ncbi:hypothetical protein [Streptomyces sp. NPDC088115]|uniref:hypothetical protein n=1 Tax=Streptomyces sp. NPDC088115 TaxID=3365824 RepID=UPI0038193479